MGNVKTYNVNNEWIMGTLTDKEEEQAMETCRRHHRNIMDECIEDARTFSGVTNDKDINILNIALTFFKRLTYHVQKEREEIVKGKLGIK